MPSTVASVAPSPNPSAWISWRSSASRVRMTADVQPATRIRPDEFAYIGPGTLAGRFIRSFWQPVYVARDLPAGRATPLRIFGEDFALYRGESGAPHVLAFRCAHRGTQLSTGWVEGGCLRCFYHGWMYDASGQCVEVPAEDASIARRVRILSYPTQKYH